jgi:ABC-type multidrug transport system ATPase subunit
VILTIHQPSSDLYKLFDKILVIDQGGRLIFSGNPLDAVAYFRKSANFINPQETEMRNLWEYKIRTNFTDC